MRLVVFVLVALLASAPVLHAQEAFAPLRFDAVTLEKSYRRARARRNIGIALTIPGVALSLLGLVLISYGTSAQEPHINAEIGELVGGGFSAVAGIVFCWFLTRLRTVPRSLARKHALPFIARCLQPLRVPIRVRADVRRRSDRSQNEPEPAARADA